MESEGIAITVCSVFTLMITVIFIIIYILSNIKKIPTPGEIYERYRHTIDNNNQNVSPYGYYDGLKVKRPIRDISEDRYGNATLNPQVGDSRVLLSIINKSRLLISHPEFNWNSYALLYSSIHDTNPKIPPIGPDKLCYDIGISRCEYLTIKCMRYAFKNDNDSNAAGVKLLRSNFYSFHDRMDLKRFTYGITSVYKFSCFLLYNILNKTIDVNRLLYNMNRIYITDCYKDIVLEPNTLCKERLLFSYLKTLPVF